MAAVYHRWLIARGNVYKPGSATVLKLVERLRKDKWIVDPADVGQLGQLRFRGAREAFAKATGGYAVRTIENTFDDADEAKRIAASTQALPAELTAAWLDDPDREEVRLVWPVDADASPLARPLTRAPEGPARYALEIHRAEEYVCPIAEGIGKLPMTCTCGEDLEFEWDEDEVIGAFGDAAGIFAECDACSRTFDPSTGAAVVKNPFDGTKDEVRGGAAYRFAIKIDCGGSFVRDAKVTFAPELVALVEAECGRAFYEIGALVDA